MTADGHDLSRGNCGKWPAGLFPLAVVVVRVVFIILHLHDCTEWLSGLTGRTINNNRLPPVILYTHAHCPLHGTHVHLLHPHTHHTASHANTTHAARSTPRTNTSHCGDTHTHLHKLWGVGDDGQTRERRDRSEHKVERNGGLNWRKGSIEIDYILVRN